MRVINFQPIETRDAIVVSGVCLEKEKIVIAKVLWFDFVFPYAGYDSVASLKCYCEQVVFWNLTGIPLFPRGFSCTHLADRFIDLFNIGSGKSRSPCIGCWIASMTALSTGYYLSRRAQNCSHHLFLIPSLSLMSAVLSAKNCRWTWCRWV